MQTVWNVQLDTSVLMFIWNHKYATLICRYLSQIYVSIFNKYVVALSKHDILGVKFDHLYGVSTGI